MTASGAPDKRSEALGWLRNLLVLHFGGLVALRLLLDADDFTNWDLIPFLNATQFDSLSELLQRPEVHFRDPFSFPTYNCGSESALSALLFRWLARFSLYWSNVLVLATYDAIFMGLVAKLVSLIHADRASQAVTWALLAMCPVLLTFPAVSAFNMQGYTVVMLALLGCEYFLRGRVVLGTILLVVAFLAISQAYPIAFFAPYFVLPWIAYRTVTIALGRPWRSLALLATANVLVVAGLVLFVHHASGGAYLTKISPLRPHEQSLSLGHVAANFTFFVRQAFFPVLRVDDLPAGFGPYFLWFAALPLGLLAVRQRSLPSRAGALQGPWAGLLAAGSAAGLLLAGYIPAFLNPIVKSQRAFFGDFFLVIVLVDSLARWRRAPGTYSKGFWGALLLLLALSDVYYLGAVATIDHARNHRPRFDFDLSDGNVRHDFDAVAKRMREQLSADDVTLVVYYPRGYAENATDPGVFFAHLLRHLGHYRNRPDLVFPCHWCDVRYGCAFPEVVNRSCTTCCYVDPVQQLEERLASGERAVVWWHETMKEVDGVHLESELERLGHQHRLERLALPGVPSEWSVHQIVSKIPPPP